MNQISDCRSNLAERWQGLRSQWEYTRGQWKDEIGDSFEREYWSSLEENLPRLLRAMDALEQSIERGIRSIREY